jgi:hypothetical protein
VLEFFEASTLIHGQGTLFLRVCESDDDEVVCRQMRAIFLYIVNMKNMLLYLALLKNIQLIC